MDAVRTLEDLEIVGGALCLDFTNTINSRYEPEHDYLVKYSDLADWALKVGVLSAARHNRLQKRAEENVRESKNALEKALSLRELLYRFFLKTTQGSDPNAEDLTRFVAFYAEAIAHSELVREADHFAVAWASDESFDALLWPIVYSGVELLLSSQLVQVKECPSCGWLFLDSSKNHSRRWCSMNTCGARDKMRRYHRRLRTKPGKRQ